MEWLQMYKFALMFLRHLETASSVFDLRIEKLQQWKKNFLLLLIICVLLLLFLISVASICS